MRWMKFESIGSLKLIGTLMLRHEIAYYSDNSDKVTTRLATQQTFIGKYCKLTSLKFDKEAYTGRHFSLRVH